MSAPAPAATTALGAPGSPRDDARRVVRATRRADRRRAVLLCALLAVAVCAAFCGTLLYSGRALAPGEVLESLAGGGPRSRYYLVVELRLPRALTAVLVGAAFGLAGAIFQTLLRNPLASPDVLGVSAGASASAVLAIAGFGLGGLAVSVAALGGAVGAAVAMYLLAWRRGVAGYRLVLVGIGLAAVLTSLISHAMTRSETIVAQQALVWLTGSLNGRNWGHVWPLVGALAVLLPLTALAARALRPLQLGDDAARGLGARAEPRRLALLGCAVALAGVGTAAAGPVGFVAFVSGPIARGLLRRNDPALLPAALVGALVVLVSDYVAQHLLGANQFPVGLVTSLVGAPYLLWLLARANRGGRGG